ncbi:MAG: hypothetical protein K1060chlam2_00436 [Chlamydiae bacterium]|nr:hypothetical protein [Chlamydiota bacterium]
MTNETITPRSFGTHDGSFHADEVTACALLIIFDQIDLENVVRTRDREKLNRCEYVCDVGGVYDPKQKRFDHHQPDYQGSFSSAGMILKYLRDEKVVSDKLYHSLNRSLIAGVDAIDNGKATLMVGYCSFSSIIANFVPARHDAGSQALQGAFLQALDFSIGHLNRLITRFHYIQECHSTIKTEMDKNEKILFFDRSMPWIESFFELGGASHPAIFVVMPIGEHWKLRGIPPTYEKRMQVRVPLPEEWAGLNEEQLKEKSQIPGAIFCHKGLFISVWETKEDALKALDYLLKKKKKR